MLAMSALQTKKEADACLETSGISWFGRQCPLHEGERYNICMATNSLPLLLASALTVAVTGCRAKVSHPKLGATLCSASDAEPVVWLSHDSTSPRLVSLDWALALATICTLSSSMPSPWLGSSDMRTPKSVIVGQGKGCRKTAAPLTLPISFIEVFEDSVQSGTRVAPVASMLPKSFAMPRVP